MISNDVLGTAATFHRAGLSTPVVLAGFDGSLGAVHIDGVVVVELVEAVEVLHQVLTTSVDATSCACLVAGPAVVLVGLQVNAGVGAV